VKRGNPLSHRIIAVGLVWNQKGELLFCRMPPDRGVFPGEWGFPGGGIEPGEHMTDALRRELREELGIEVDAIRPAFFKDGVFEKLFQDGSRKPMYLIFLVFHCQALSEQIRLNAEFAEYRWVSEADVRSMHLNEVTLDTLRRIGPWEQAR
jgi:nucleoside triphosphatase